MLRLTNKLEGLRARYDLTIFSTQFDEIFGTSFFNTIIRYSLILRILRLFVSKYFNIVDNKIMVIPYGGLGDIKNTIP